MRYTISFDFIGNAQQLIASVNALGGTLGLANTQLRTVQSQSASTARSLNVLGESTNSFGTSLLKTFGTVGVLGGVFGALRLFNSLIKESIENAGEFQRLGSSFTAILAAPFGEKDSKVAITPELLQSLRVESERIFQNSQLAAIQTVATTKEYVSTLQSALAVGQQIGLSQNQIEIITKRLVLAAGAFGVEQEKVGGSIAQIFTGSVRVTNQLGRNLGLATVEQRKLLKEAISTGHLFEFLEAKTRSFAALGKEVQNNFVNVSASIKDIFQIGGAQAVQPLFNLLTEELIKFRERFISDDALNPLTTQFQAGIKTIQNALVDILPEVKALGQELLNLFGTFTGHINDGTFSLKTFLTVLTALVRTLANITGGPLGTFLGLIIKLRLGIGLFNFLIARGSALILFFSTNVGIAARAQAAYIASLELTGNVTAATNARTQAYNAALLAGATDAEAAALAEGAYATSLASTGNTALASAAKLRVFSTAISSSLGIIGLIVTALSFLFNLSQETSGRADERRKSEEKLNEEYAKSEQRLGEYGQTLQVVSNIQKLMVASKLGEKTKEQTEEFEKLKDALQGVGLSAELIKNLELGKLDQSGLDEINKALVKFSQNATDVAIAAKGVVGPIKEEFGLISVEADNSIAAYKQLKEEQAKLTQEVATFTKGGKATAVALEDAQIKLGAVTHASERLEKALRTVANIEGIPFQQFIENEQLAIDKTEQLLPELEKIARIAQNNALPIIQQAEAIADTQAKMEALRVSLKDVDFTSAKYNDTINLLKQSTIELAIEKGFLREKIELIATATGKSNEQVQNEIVLQLKNQIATISTAVAKDKEAEARARNTFELLAEKNALGQATEEQVKNAEASLAAAFAQSAGDEAKLKQLNNTVQLINSINFKIKTPSGDNKKKKGGSRDELTDFLKDIDQQLTLLKKINDLLEHEVDRFVDQRKKLIRQLIDEGTISADIGAEAEAQLVLNQFKLIDDLAVAREDLLKKSEQIAQTIAARQEQRDKKKDKKGTDRRDRDFQAFVKQNEEFISAETKRVDNVKKAEESLTEIYSRQAKANIDILKKQFEKQDELDKRTIQSRQKVIDALSSLGLFSPENLENQRFKSEQDVAKIDADALFAKRFPELSPRFRDLLKKAKSQTAGLINVLGSREEQEEEFSKFVEISKKIVAIKDQLATLDEERAKKAKLSGKELNAFDEKKIALKTDLTNLSKEIVSLGGGIKLDPNKIAELAKAFVTLNSFNLTAQQRIELFLEADKERRDNALKILEHLLKQKQIEQEQLKFKIDINEFDLKRLDILEQLIVKQQELGTLTLDQSNKELLQLNQQKIALLEQEKLIQERILATEFPNGVQSPEGQKRQLEVTASINDLNVKLFELRNRAFELSSPLFALSQGFKNVSDAVGGLPEPFNKLQNVFKGLSDLALVLANKGRPKSPADDIKDAAHAVRDAGKDFSLTFLNTGNLFLDAVVRKILELQTGGSGVGVANSPISDAGGAFDAAKKAAKNAKSDIGTGIASFITKASSVAVGLLNAIASGDTGSIISAVGAGIAQFGGPIGQAIGAVVEVVGGIVSFFGARAKQKTKEMAQAITEGIDELKKAISSGAIGLGEGIRQLQQKEADAVRQLSGRKGGKEELKSITKDINDEISQLRDQAKKIQTDFISALETLRLPQGLRDLAAQITDAKGKVKEFFASFENPQDALNSIDQIREFLQLTIGEIKDDIKKTQDDLLQQLKDNTDQFNQSQRAILLEGRIDPRISVAEDKRRRLVDLEKEFQKKQIDLNNQIKTEKDKLDFVNKRLDIEKLIRNLSRDAAADLGASADALSRAAASLGAVVNNLPRFTDTLGQSGAQSINLNLQINGQTVQTQTVGISASRQLQLSARVNPALLAKYQI